MYAIKNSHYIVATTVLSFIGSVYRGLKAFQGDAFGILIASKDFPNLMQQINSGKLEKIPYITQIISSFMKMDCLDQDRVSALLYLKVIRHY
jgi:Zn-dependent alcohol dehydrogenase